MKYLLDTNACVAHLRGKNAGSITSRLLAGSGDISLCSVVKAELFYGAERSADPARNYAKLNAFFNLFPSFSFTDSAAAIYGRIRVHLENCGTPIGPNDLIIASIAIAEGLILVTHNTSEFGRVPGLQIEDWQVER
jgi:tRNA(fMet)-specific endonuclease VapC